LDGTRFDDLTRSLAGCTSRRGALKSLLGAIGAGVVGAVTGSQPVGAGADADREDRQRAEARGRPYRRAGKPCDAGQPCGLRAPCVDGFCTPLDCLIDGTIYQSGDLNPDSPCQSCAPTKDNWTDWLGAAPDGEACEVEDDASCLSTSGQCLSGECVREPLDDGTVCGGVPGRVCCNGECCSPTECCEPTGFCEECGPHCTIDGDVYDDGVSNPDPDSPCEVCNPGADPENWSPALDNSVCGGDLDGELLCCRGVCCGERQCCTDGSCGACRCEIDNREYESGVVNPRNKCEVCNADLDREDWTPRNRNAPCGTFNDRYCCAGECCPAGECCNQIGECEECGCEIGGPGGQEVVADGVNPANTCQVCKPDQDRENWTVLDDDEPCGNAFDDRVCCGGICCPQGQCCEGGTCQDCGCQIGDDDPIDPRTINPDNVCQICDPSRARLTWSPVDDDTSCGFVDEQNLVCCGGICCDPGECCLLGACGECLCSIEGTNYAADRVNPDNDCEICKPASDPFGWSPAQDRTACGDDRVCCAGSCCEAGLCCILGVCGACGCQIGEETFDDFEVNPANECEWCDPVLERFAWSPRDGEPCGSSDDQFCCAGVCCESGKCCSTSGVCETCPCLIDGQVWGDGAVHPDIDCLVCRSADNRLAWSAAFDDEPCGDNEDQECCSGICCPPDTCCDRGVCEPCKCTIGDATYEEFDDNPDNVCQHCDLGLNPFDWSPNPEDPPCGPNGDQRCCNGVCCPRATCCSPTELVCEQCRCLIGDVEYEDRTINPDNACEICDVPLDPFAWTPMSEEASCGANDEEVCCVGVCCPPGYCCSLGGVCEACRCEIGTGEYADLDPNPDNLCEYCKLSESTEAWTPTPDYSVCSGPLDTVNRYCCRGVCCEDRECCRSNGTCGPCVCVIDETEYDEGDHNPHNDCEYCSPVANDSAWTVGDDDDICGETQDQKCCGGVCCPLGDCCSADRTCESCGCEIDGQHYQQHQLNPDNECEECSTGFDPSGWTPRSFADCGTTGNQICCDGVCCEPHHRCTLQGVCEPTSCEIDGVVYEDGAVNPANVCEVCDLAGSTTDWTPGDDNVPCGDGGDRVCCAGSCCAEGECCTLLVCGFCGCEIDGEVYEELAVNPANACEVCDPVLERFAWSPQADDSACGAGGEQVCCGGVCCAEGECCTLEGVCEPCNCTIDEVEYEEDAVNPENECEVCSPSDDKTAWSPAHDGDSCGPNVDQVCCGGVCCPEGQCCGEAGACEPCGCTIDGQSYRAGESHVEFFCLVCNPAYPTVWSPRAHPDCPPPCTIDGVLHPNGAVNPANPCEGCNGGSSWSPSNALVCGQGQSCCGGICCSPGQCCTAAGVCGTVGCVVQGCVIGGVQYADGDVNPNDPCQACNESVSQSTWSSNGFGSCGPAGEQFCAGGVCCGLGICPDQDVCGDYCDAVCAIGGVLYHSGDRNPANDCDVCAPSTNHTSWSLVCSDECCAPLFCTHDAQNPCGPRD
jgi:hypothetical protein